MIGTPGKVNSQWCTMVNWTWQCSKMSKHYTLCVGPRCFTDAHLTPKPSELQEYGLTMMPPFLGTTSTKAGSASHAKTKAKDMSSSIKQNECINKYMPIVTHILALGFSHPGLQKVTRPHVNAALVKSHPACKKYTVLC